MTDRRGDRLAMAHPLGRKARCTLSFPYPSVLFQLKSFDTMRAMYAWIILSSPGETHEFLLCPRYPKLEIFNAAPLVVYLSSVDNLFVVDAVDIFCETLALHRDHALKWSDRLL